MQIKEVAVLSERGSRSGHEDAVFHAESLLAVADGLGDGALAGIAARLATEGLRRHLPSIRALTAGSTGVGASAVASAHRLRVGEALEAAFLDVHADVERETADPRGGRMAATLLAALIAGPNLHIAHVGASRAYLLRAGRLRLLTEDHTLAMARLRQGRMTSDEFRASPLRQQLYQALGSGRDVDVDLAEVALADDDVILLCSPGIPAALDDRQLLGCVQRGTLRQGASRLVDAARKTGSEDHLSVALVRVAAEAASDTVDGIAAALSQVFLFRGLSEAERLVIAPFLDRRALAPGEVLFQDGEPGDAFYAVVSGTIRVSKGGTPLVDVKAGGHLGELVLSRPAPRSAQAVAMDHAVVYGLSRERFQEIVRRRPALGASLALALLDHVGDRLRDMTDRVQVVERVMRGDLRPKGLSTVEAVLAATRGNLKG